MILIVCALHAEARPLIDRYQLKRNMDVSSHEVYEGKDTALIVSGIGKIRSAAATTLLISRFGKSSPSLRVINTGICGSRGENDTGDLFLINKITDTSSGRSYYPDMLIKSGLKEAALQTFDHPVKDPLHPALSEQLADMEASGFFEAAALFLPASQIACLKIVSDKLSPDSLALINRQFVEELISRNIERIAVFLGKFSSVAAPEAPSLSFTEEDTLKRITRHLKLTRYQTLKLANLALSYKIRNRRDLSCIKEFSEVRTATKQEGKKIFEQIEQLLSC